MMTENNNNIHAIRNNSAYRRYWKCQTLLPHILLFSIFISFVLRISVGGQH